MAKLSDCLKNNADSIYNDYIRLRLNNPDAQNKVIVLVEGKDDVPFYSKFFKFENVLIVPCFGCSFVPQIQNYLKKKKRIKQCLAIIDSDFSNLSKRDVSEPDCFFTQFHDVEMELISIANVFENALRPLGVFTVKYQQRTALLKELYYLSMARYFNMARRQRLTDEGTGLDLRSISVSELSSVESINKYFKPTEHKKVSSFKIKAFKRFVEKNRHVDLFQITNGHDFLCRWSYKLNRGGCRIFEEEELREALINAYKECYIKNSYLYKKIAHYALKQSLDIMAY